MRRVNLERICPLSILKNWYPGPGSLLILRYRCGTLLLLPRGFAGNPGFSDTGGNEFLLHTRGFRQTFDILNGWRDNQSRFRHPIRDKFVGTDGINCNRFPLDASVSWINMERLNLIQTRVKNVCVRRFNSVWIFSMLDRFVVYSLSPILGDIYLWKLVFIPRDRLILFSFFSFLKYARSKIWKYGEEKENMNDEWSFYNNKY